MSLQDNDRLEQFFRKAADKPDVTFNEDDWKKLEARLDAADVGTPGKVPVATRIITAVVIGIVLLTGTGIWLGARYDIFDEVIAQTEPPEPANQRAQATDESPSSTSSLPDDTQSKSVDNRNPGQESGPVGAIEKGSTSVDTGNSETSGLVIESLQDKVAVGERESPKLLPQGEQRGNQALPESTSPPVTAAKQSATEGILRPISKSKIYEELVKTLSANAVKNKQEAVVELSGAEEADTPGVQTMLEKEHASHQEKHVATPRLSLLLSFAPDFSSTSIQPYSPPGKAFGAVLHYHFIDRWSLSAGIIQNQKVYSGDGEDYTPPSGYWKYATNGIIPESIDGSCSILEFPLMLQYIITRAGSNRFVIGAGTSSYLMQSESYRYHFSEPNPGAKEGWDSRGSSRVYFNMVNITAGYERQVTRGLSFGIEPYLKLPLKDIGWTNLKLYSMGASITMRYALIQRKQTVPGAVRSRGPD